MKTEYGAIKNYIQAVLAFKITDRKFARDFITEKIKR